MGRAREAAGEHSPTPYLIPKVLPLSPTTPARRVRPVADDDLTPPESKASDLTRSLVKATVSAVPYFCSPAAELSVMSSGRARSRLVVHGLPREVANAVVAVGEGEVA